MKHHERGFSTIEVIIGVALVTMITLGGAAVSYQTRRVTDMSRADMTAFTQVQTAGYWIGRDAQMAESIFTDNLTPPNFIIVAWTEQNYGGDPIYHSVTYFFEGLSGGVGILKRRHWSSSGADEYTVIARYIYYDPSDPAATSQAGYVEPALTVRLTAVVGGASESREYVTRRRPNFN